MGDKRLPIHNEDLKFIANAYNSVGGEIEESVSVIARNPSTGEIVYADVAEQAPLTGEEILIALARIDEYLGLTKEIVAKNFATVTRLGGLAVKRLDELKPHTPDELEKIRSTLETIHKKLFFSIVKSEPEKRKDYAEFMGYMHSVVERKDRLAGRERPFKDRFEQ